MISSPLENGEKILKLFLNEINISLSHFQKLWVNHQIGIFTANYFIRKFSSRLSSSFSPSQPLFWVLPTFFLLRWTISWVRGVLKLFFSWFFGEVCWIVVKNSFNLSWVEINFDAFSLSILPLLFSLHSFSNPHNGGTEDEKNVEIVSKRSFNDFYPSILFVTSWHFHFKSSDHSNNPHSHTYCCCDLSGFQLHIVHVLLVQKSILLDNLKGFFLFFSLLKMEFFHVFCSFHSTFFSIFTFVRLTSPIFINRSVNNTFFHTFHSTTTTSLFQFVFSRFFSVECSLFIRDLFLHFLCNFLLTQGHNNHLNKFIFIS